MENYKKVKRETWTLESWKHGKVTAEMLLLQRVKVYASVKKVNVFNEEKFRRLTFALTNIKLN